MNSVTGLAVGRILIGMLALLAPRSAARLFQLRADEQPQVTYMNRMFGSREITLGAVTLLAPPETRRSMVLIGVAVDAADAAAGVLAGREGVVSKRASLMLTLPALGAVAAGIAGIRR
ncbi:DUF4267 domain-containing protein [Nocardioides daejeonensis]|uniref:DUF4267 domain-containing protein n=1 Tax=Nocardioides daejeonensis TaxID=1046556 RepID=UPI000D749502|nr:DUF4267 domain-containing protein [Nocardioides daejeonensis]